ncbi:MAG: TCR/Tet family MFS transporter, partial [Mesorhizobium sp.]
MAAGSPIRCTRLCCKAAEELDTSMIDPKTARRGLALVFTTLLLDIIGFGIIMP